ncbi:hypothetical protein, partial [Micromonospora sp. S4605]|uniref:hypothetical protein n=1 Tax=Micromonospora sp. S4605 TaxID=1420897 RepID=UPI001E437FC8
PEARITVLNHLSSAHTYPGRYSHAAPTRHRATRHRAFPTPGRPAPRPRRPTALHRGSSRGCPAARLPASRPLGSDRLLQGRAYAG